MSSLVKRKKTYKTFDNEIKVLDHEAIIQKLIITDVNNEPHELQYETLYSQNKDNFDLLLGADIMKHHYPIVINENTISLKIKGKDITVNRLISKSINIQMQQQINLHVIFERIDPLAKLLEPSEIGFTLYSNQYIEILPNESQIIGTGVLARIPPTYYGIIKGKNGWIFNLDLAITEGVIKPSFTGEIKIIIRNNELNSLVTIKKDTN